ncbi:MAG TPA: hypothetical protein P5089_02365 [Candidatus Portnoybacteria bacterium]|nr:hypothetical protein [Candidatus Portnoybacteria bacterium]
MKAIKDVVAITPVWNEPLGMIQGFLESVEQVKKKLVGQGIAFRHFFLNDCALNLLGGYPTLVEHNDNKGLALTLIDGYQAVIDFNPQPDLIVRLDCQEHNPAMISDIVDIFSHSQAQAVFLPVWYWVEGQNRPAMKNIAAMMVEFTKALSPIRKEVVYETFNQKFPLGYQAFRFEALQAIFPELERGIKIFKERTGKPATWGLDLLTILIAAHHYPKAIDFIFGGWSNPWLQNRSHDKIEAQKQKAKMMIEVAGDLGIPIIEEQD